MTKPKYLAVVLSGLLLMAPVAAIAQVKQTRVRSSSSNFAISSSDFAIGLRRTVKPHATVVRLPADAKPGQEFAIDDLAGNFNKFPVTIVAPAGHSFRDSHEFVLNEDGQSATVRYYGAKRWSAH